jgi:hypothetical protein
MQYSSREEQLLTNKYCPSKICSEMMLQRECVTNSTVSSCGRVVVRSCRRVVVS